MEFEASLDIGAQDVFNLAAEQLKDVGLNSHRAAGNLLFITIELDPFKPRLVWLATSGDHVPAVVAVSPVLKEHAEFVQAAGDLVAAWLGAFEPERRAQLGAVLRSGWHVRLCVCPEVKAMELALCDGKTERHLALHYAPDSPIDPRDRRPLH
jgi:hypothetical protein